VLFSRPVALAVCYKRLQTIKLLQWVFERIGLMMPIAGCNQKPGTTVRVASGPATGLLFYAIGGAFQRLVSEYK